MKRQARRVTIEIAPAAPGEGFSFVNRIRGGAIPTEYIPAVEKGIKDVLVKGIIAGYPIVDLSVTLVDGSFHEVDSSDMAFRACSRQAFKKGFLQAAPRLLEPVMSVHVTCPEDLAGTVSGDLCSKRGRIQGIDVREGAVAHPGAAVGLASHVGRPGPGARPPPPRVR